LNPASGFTVFASEAKQRFQNGQNDGWSPPASQKWLVSATLHRFVKGDWKGSIFFAMGGFLFS
jgi:hypothetical protein